MTKYDQSIIYKLCCKDTNITDIYVGSTTAFKNRKYQHKRSCNNEKGKNYNYKVYIFIRDNGGFDNWDMIEIEKYKATDKRDLEKRERYYIESLKSSLNKNIPTRTIKEYQLNNKDKIKEYRENNKDKIKEQRKEYRENNKDVIKEQCKEYYEKNKDVIKEQKKEYYKKNKDVIKEQKKEYYEKNIDKRKEYDRQRYLKNYEKNKDKINEKRRQRYLKKKEQKQSLESKE